MDLQDIFQDVPIGARKYGVIGWPLSHTLSPAMHNAAMAFFGLGAVYRAIPVPPEELKDFAQQAQRFYLDGFNATVPHKESIGTAGFSNFRLKDPLAHGETASVNTLARRQLMIGDRLRFEWEGASTDGEGFLGDLDALGIPVKGKDVALLGAGGSAKAILIAMHRLGKEPKSVTVLNRTYARAQQLEQDFGMIQLRSEAQRRTNPSSPARPVDLRVIDLGWADQAKAALERADLLINATNAELTPGDKFSLDFFPWIRADSTVYDLVYGRRTELLEAAAARGARAVDGLGMLVHQGALAFEIWFGEELKNKGKWDPNALRTTMRRAAEDELTRRGNA